MSSEAVKAGQIIADEFLRRIAKRYENCNLRIYPDMPTLTPVEAVLRCAQEEGFILTNVIPGGPIGGAGELTALVKEWRRVSRLTAIGDSTMATYRTLGACADELERALAAKAPQGVPAYVPADCPYCAALWELDQETMKHRHPSVSGFGAFAYPCEPAPERKLPAPVSDDTIHHGMVPPAAEPTNDHELLVGGVVRAAVELAILRGDLRMDNGDAFEEMSESEREDVISDTWNAMNGEGTCDGGQVKELKAIYAALARDRHASAERVRNKVQTWANNCAVTEEHHRLNDNLEGAAYHRGAKGAYQRVVDEILALPPSTGEKSQ